MFENLSERLERSFKILKGQGKITELNVAETLKEVRRSLLDADVNYKIAKDFTNRVKEKALGMNVLTAVKPGQMMVKIVHDELAELMGGKNVEVDIKGNPAIILMSGLQGSGKTTFSGKFANLLKNKKGKKPLLVACDVYRPAAIEQLKVLGEQIQVPVYSDETTKDPVRIALDAIKQAKAKGYDVVIVDTAGRLAIDEQMMNEIAAIKEAIHPNETLFVVDAMTGQDAADTAKAFGDALPLTGVILTKVDGDARGGAALSVRHITGKPIKFIGVGEKTDALEPFHPDRIASRILGMGDVLSLIEDLQRNVDQEKAEKLAKKFKEKKGFDLEDFREQLGQMKNMGGMMGMLDKLPGMSQLPADMKDKVDDRVFKQMEAIINSMTMKERQNPDLIKGSRKKRIAAGSGTQVQDVNRLLKQFTQMQKMMKKMQQGGMKGMMRNMQGLMGGGGRGGFGGGFFGR